MSTSDPVSTVWRLNDLLHYQEGAVVSRQLLKKKTGNVTLFAFGAGEGLSEHRTPFDALLNVIDGEAEVRIGEETFTIATGEAIVLPANIPHAVHATSDFRMILTMIKEAEAAKG